MQRGVVSLPGIAVLLLCVASFEASVASAQTPVGSWIVEGEIELGGRTTWGDDDAGKFLEYRDLDSGAVGAYDVLLRDASNKIFLRSIGENLGYDDQHYWFEGGRYGRYTIDAYYRELPHVFSTRATSLHRRQGSETFRLPAGVQSRIAGAADRSGQLATELLAARPTDLEFRWLEAGTEIDLQWTDEIRLYSNYRIQDKYGTRVGATAWGTPGGNFAVFPLKVDEKIHELRTGGEWLLGATSLSLEYLGSLFENELNHAVVDNPLVAANAANASMQSRQALAPDNSAHSLALSASSPLPLPFPARVVGNLVYGVRLQDQSFLPHTLNPAITSAGLALPQGDLNGRVNTVLANLRVNVDPSPDLDVDLRYRLYRYDNESDEILFPAHVSNDDALVTSARRSVANSYSVHKASMDAGYELTRGLTGHVGYFWEYWNRSNDRQVENLHEHGPTAKLDYRFSQSTSALASYSFRSRSGDGYDPFAYFDRTLDTPGKQAARRFGEFPSLRKFDQADRDTHRFDVQARSLRGEKLELTFSGGLFLADYRNTDAGLTEQWMWNAGGEIYYQVHPHVGVRAFYDFESIRYEQSSRWRPRSFFVAPPGQILAIDNPLNDWSSQTKSYFHSTGFQVDFAVIPERIDLALGYDFHFGRERTTSSGPAGFVAAAPPTTSGDGGNAASFPAISEQLHALLAGLTLRLNEQVSFTAQYRFEIFSLDDDSRRQGLGPFLGASNVNGSGAFTPSTDVFLGNDVGDYHAHVFRLLARIHF